VIVMNVSQTHAPDFLPCVSKHVH